MVVQILQHLQIVCAGGVAAVDELHQQGVVAGCLEVAVDEVVPALAVGVADLSVAIAGQVHKIAVVPGVLDTRARFLRLHSLLMRLDLPTLERPEKLSSGRSLSGSWLEMP